MAKGSVRKKGKKWYYRCYVEDASGNRIQKEFPGTESKSETESLLRKAMEDYETKMFLAEAKNLTLGDMLDMWVKARFSEQRNGHGLSVHRQPDQAASHRQAQAENRHRRPSASLYGPVELRRHES